MILLEMLTGVLLPEAVVRCRGTTGRSRTTGKGAVVGHLRGDGMEATETARKGERRSSVRFWVVVRFAPLKGLVIGFGTKAQEV